MNYQQMAMRTANPECKDLFNFVLGLTGEAGEVADIIKKHYFQGHELIKDDLVDEMGDCAWYLALGCEVMEISFDEMLQKNIEKLKKRYPNGFNHQDSLNRVEYQNDDDNDEKAR